MAVQGCERASLHVFGRQILSFSHSHVNRCVLWHCVLQQQLTIEVARMDSSARYMRIMGPP
jgi:hypothetical protein